MTLNDVKLEAETFESEAVQMEAARLETLFAEHPGWTTADVAAEAAGQCQANQEMADQLAG